MNKKVAVQVQKCEEEGKEGRPILAQGFALATSRSIVESLEYLNTIRSATSIKRAHNCQTSLRNCPSEEKTCVSSHFSSSFLANWDYLQSFNEHHKTPNISYYKNHRASLLFDHWFVEKNYPTLTNIHVTGISRRPIWPLYRHPYVPLHLLNSSW